MQEQDEARAVDRRQLLRRAGTVAAGAAGATVAGAMVAGPAQAADGQNLVIGQANTGTATTKLTAGSTSNPAVRLENTSGSPLSLATSTPSTSAPGGSVYIDEWGDFAAVADHPQYGKFVSYTYSPNWATMTVPLSPIRWLDSRNAAGRQFIKGATYDSAGRVVPKNSNSTPDAIIDLSAIFAGGYGAVQANLTVANATGHGWAALWDEGDWQGPTSSINFTSTVPAIANFTQTVIGSDRTIRLKTNRAAAFILDIVGFIMTDPFVQFPENAASVASARGANGASLKRWQKRTANNAKITNGN